MTADTQTRTVPAFAEDEDTDRKICLICSKGTLDMAYPGLVLANGALQEGIETHVFFTFWGLDMITKKKMDHLKATPVGNTSMPMPQAIAPLPGMTAMATHMLKKEIHDLGIPDVPEFLQQIADAGGQLWACKMSADMMDLEQDDLFDEVVDIIDVSEFMDLSEGAQVIFI